MAYNGGMTARAVAVCLTIALGFAGCSAFLTANDDDVDAGSDELADAGTPDAEMPLFTEYNLLSETGLYRDIDNRIVADDVIEYAPEFTSWVDGAHFRTWIWVPPGQQVDTSDMDYWNFPIGTKAWQQVARMQGEQEIVLETRMILSTGLAKDQYIGYAFVWNDDNTDAVRNPDGPINIKGTSHDVPKEIHCNQCHRGQPGNILGFQAVQLSYDAPVNVNTLYADGVLSHPPATEEMYPIPGDPVEKAALGYLHADCAHCHTSGLGLGSYDVTGLSTRIFTDDVTVEDTEAYTTNVGQPLTHWSGFGLSQRLVPQSPNQSGTLFRMNYRGGRPTMPPTYTEVVNQDAVDAVRAWLDQL